MAFEIRPKVATPWARCQGSTLLEQLNCGIRYFDLRLDFSNEHLEFCHGVVGCCGDLQGMLHEVKQWSEEHLSEIILLQFRCEWDQWPNAPSGDTDYELLDQRKLHLHELISAVLQDRLIHAVGDVSIRLPIGELRKHGNIAVVQDSAGLKRPNVFWLSDTALKLVDYSFHVSAPWYDKQTWEDLELENTKGLEARDITMLHITHGALTAKFSAAWCWSPLHYVFLMPSYLNRQCKANLLSWVQEQHQRLNIISLDFVCEQETLIQVLFSKNMMSASQSDCIWQKE